MIHDSLDRFRLYNAGPVWDHILNFIDGIDDQTKDGMYEIKNVKDAYARVMTYETKAPQDGILETHDRFVDVHMSLEGSEGIEVFERDELEEKDAYNSENDATFYHSPTNPGVLIYNYPGRFSLFWPWDAHRTQVRMTGAEGAVKKLVIKIPLTALKPASR